MTILLWFGIGWATVAVAVFVVWPRMLGRIPTDARAAYRHSAEWYALREAVAARRGYQCAAGWHCAGPLNLHHWTTVAYGFERPWMLVYLCERHHHGDWRYSAHWWANWPLDHERWLPVATALVVGYGKARRLGHRARQTTTVRRRAA